MEEVNDKERTDEGMEEGEEGKEGYMNTVIIIIICTGCLLNVVFFRRF